MAVTPNELGEAWDGAKLHLPLRATLNGELIGAPNAGVDMTFDFPALIMHAAKTRELCAGTILGSGTISNRDADGNPRVVTTDENGFYEFTNLPGDDDSIYPLGRPGLELGRPGAPARPR